MNNHVVCPGCTELGRSGRGHDRREIAEVQQTLAEFRKRLDVLEQCGSPLLREAVSRIEKLENAKPPAPHGELVACGQVPLAGGPMGSAVFVRIPCPVAPAGFEHEGVFAVPKPGEYYLMVDTCGAPMAFRASSATTYLPYWILRRLP